MICHIAIMDSARGVARNGIIPWHLPNEIKEFAALTKTHGGLVLMGRKTYETIGHPLEGRHNMVATRSREYNAPGVELVHNVPAFLASHRNLWIIGGVQLYEQTLAMADELYITEVAADFQCDQFYPEFSRLFTPTYISDWHTENGIQYRRTIYIRA